MARKCLALIGLIVGMSTAQAGIITQSLSWQGPNGYAMTGTFSYSDALSGPITGGQLSTFVIQGFQTGSPIGSWNLASGFPGFNFNFNFNATTLVFAQGGTSGGSTGQEWDVTSGGNTCPNPGFGFASGLGGQGLCVNGSFVNDSFNSGVFNLTASPASAVPEPATGALTGLAALGLFLRKIRTGQWGETAP
jgi:hypothetical protein